MDLDLSAQRSVKATRIVPLIPSVQAARKARATANHAKVNVLVLPKPSKTQPALPVLIRIHGAAALVFDIATPMGSPHVMLPCRIKKHATI